MACGIMSFSRIAVAVHWPTDIIFGIIVGALVAWILLSKKGRRRLNKNIISPIIGIEKWIFKTVFKID